LNSSYSDFNLQIVHSNANGFNGGVFDGRFVYFVPYGSSGNSGLVVRYDTSKSFDLNSSYSDFNLQIVHSNANGFNGGVFDGRFIYYFPSYTAYIGLVVRYDTSKPFDLNSSYNVRALRSFVNSNFLNSAGGVFDGRFVYFVPYGSKIFVRFVGWGGGVGVPVGVQKFAVSSDFFMRDNGFVGFGTDFPVNRLNLVGDLNVVRSVGSGFPSLFVAGGDGNVGVNSVGGFGFRLDVNGNVRVVDDLNVGGLGVFKKDVNVSSGPKRGVSIKADFNRICFPADSCEGRIDYNGDSFVFGVGI
jgi:hypothetical protein